MELVKEEIIRALECCIGIKGIDACANCPACLGCEDCVDFLREESLALIKELIEESQKWQEAYYCADSACRELSSKCDELTEENEKLNEQINREARCQYDLCGQIVTLRDDVKYIKADTVQKMQEKIRAKSEYGTINISPWQLDQITKEMLEENNV